MGWEGEGDAWYAPPNVDDFTAVDGFVYNIYPTGRKGDVICSGRVLAAGRPVSGAKVSVANPGSHTRGRCTTDSNGVYALILAPGTHEKYCQYWEVLRDELTSYFKIGVGTMCTCEVCFDMMYGGPIVSLTNDEDGLTYVYAVTKPKHYGEKEEE